MIEPAQTIIVLCDTREPGPPHPWEPYLPAGVVLQRATLETGDFALAGAPDGAVIERKTASDFLAAIGRERERFTRELLRARFCQSFAIVIEGTLPQVLRENRGIHPSAILGTLAAWNRRGFPTVFCGTTELAAQFAFRYLVQPLNEARRLVAACEHPAPAESAEVAQ